MTNAILFDKIPIKLSLRNIQREVDIVVKNSSESILLMSEDYMIGMITPLQDN